MITNEKDDDKISKDKLSNNLSPLQVDIARNTISELDLPASSWCGFFATAMLAVTLGEVVKINNAQPTPYMVC